MTKIDNAKEAFVMKLGYLYDVEKQLVKALPMLAKAASDEELKAGFINHLKETEIQVERLERIFEILGVEPKEIKSDGVRGIIDDAALSMGADAEEGIKDMMIAGSARFAEHFEIAGYMSAILEAESLDLPEAVELLTQTLTEEENADKTLVVAMMKN